jgi:hypothetical protein
MEWCAGHVDLRLVVGRQTIQSIDQVDSYLTGTDISSLMARGNLDIVAYVSSGFKTIPKKIVLRTDNAEAEAMALTQAQHDAMAENSEPEVDEQGNDVEAVVLP